MCERPMAHPEVERQRIIIRQFVAPLLGDDALTLEMFRESMRWARGIPRRRAIPLVREWFGWRRYRQRRFRAAAWLHARAARAHSTPRPRSNCLTNAASASLEVGAYDEAIEHARAAAQIASDTRLALHEARATWIERAARFRRGDRVPADPDYEAALRGDLAAISACVALLVEASIALRAGDHRRSAAIASCAASTARASGHTAVECLALGVAAAAGSAPAGAGDRLRATLASIRLPEVRAQAAALWTAFGGGCGADLPASLLEIPTTTRDGIAADSPLEVLSWQEFTEVLQGGRAIAREGG
jgi:hypothetical protein